jgi:6-methylsalicylate decarboxylase
MAFHSLETGNVLTTQTTRVRRRAVDVHMHFIPEFYRDALASANMTSPDGINALPRWDEEDFLRVMDSLQVETAVLSISSPGVHFGNHRKALQLARKVNDVGRRLMDRYPGRIGLFASLPLPDLEASIEEAARALDDLGADGVVFESNHHGVYLGDPVLDPLYAELDKRSAVIFVHPTSPACACSARESKLYPRPMLEFLFDSTRSIADMVLSGVLKRFPNLKVIVPHAGAALPILVERIELLLPLLGKPEESDPPSMREAMRELHFDLAGAPVPQLLPALLSVADIKHIHYGSDYPFTPEEACSLMADRIASTPILTSADHALIWRDNALELFPRFANPKRNTPPAV